MKKVVFLAFAFAAAMVAAPVLAQPVVLNPAAVAADAATGPVALVGVADLRTQLGAAEVALAQAQADIRIARSIGGAALMRAKKVEASYQAKVAELEAKISSETIKAQAEVEKEAIKATVEVVKTQHGVPASAPATDAVAAATAPTPPASATGPARIACLPGTTYRRISVTDGPLRSGYREECLPIPGYISPEAAEKPRTMPLWLKYSAFIVGGAAIGGAGTYAVNRFGDGAGGAGDVAGGAVIGAVGGAAFCALTELF